MKRKTKSALKKELISYLATFIIFLFIGLIIGNHITNLRKREILAEQKKIQADSLNKLKKKVNALAIYLKTP